MALQSTDIDAQLEKAANELRSLRADASKVAGLSGSTSPVDQLQADKLVKIQAEAADLYTKVLAVKNGIDQLGL